MTQQTTDERPVAAAVIAHTGHVLLGRRRVSEGELSWQFPAGKVEPGETKEEAAVRETKEETGLHVRAVRLLGARVHPATGRHITYVACEVVSCTANVVNEEELDRLAWVRRNEIPHFVPYGLYEPVQEYLDSVLEA